MKRHSHTCLPACHFHRVKLKVNKLTSEHDPFALDYYTMPFCRPAKGINKEHENLGELLSGDRIENSAYELTFMEDIYCRQVCATHLGRGEHKDHDPNKLARSIKLEYHNNWILDNLPSASKSEDEMYMTTVFAQGFPIGAVGETDDIAYIHNHVNIEVVYHKVSGKVDEYRIVQFVVEPFSIKHDFEPLMDDEVEDGKGAVINKPILSCDPNAKIQNHTSYDMAMASDPQPASGKALFTYDVIWRENPNLPWSARWDAYLNTKSKTAARFRWFSITRKMIIVFILSGLVAAVLVRNLSRDMARYNTVAMDEEERADAMEEFGWKLVHSDVFRPPTTKPLLLAVFCGTGAQLLSMLFLTMLFAALGFMNPSRRGRLVEVQLLLFILLGAVAGYTTARFYKTFKGKSWHSATVMTAMGFPSLCFLVFFVMDIVAITQDSTDAVPIWTIFVLLILWFGISTPLVFFGAYFGYKQDAIEFPVNTSGIPRQIPEQPWFLWVPATMAICGIVPYGSCIVELHMILNSIWEEQVYYVYGFLFVVFLILLITAAEITVLFNYFQLCGEDHRWWWRAFANGGGAALWVLLYAISYFKTLETNEAATYFLYFGYMFLLCMAAFLALGFVGLASSLHFNKTIFASVKID
jgi:transmembrane 9 superfamily protein 2/4